MSPGASRRLAARFRPADTVRRSLVAATIIGLGLVACASSCVDRLGGAGFDTGRLGVPGSSSWGEPPTSTIPPLPPLETSAAPRSGRPRDRHSATAAPKTIEPTAVQPDN